MKIIERTTTGLAALERLSRSAMSQYPSDLLIKRNQTIIVKPTFTDFNHDRFVEKYGEDYAVYMVYMMQNIPIVISNRRGRKKTIYNAYYQFNVKNPAADLIYMNIPSVFGQPKPKRVRFGELLASDHFMSTLVHEMRHVGQRLGYLPFMLSATKYDYEVDPTEIDASFHQYLNYIDRQVKYNHADYTPGSYVANVMYYLGKQKDLTDKQYRHYKKKAADHYTFMVQGDESYEHKSTAQRFKEKYARAKRLSEYATYMSDRMPAEQPDNNDLIRNFRLISHILVNIAKKAPTIPTDSTRLAILTITLAIINEFALRNRIDLEIVTFLKDFNLPIPTISDITDDVETYFNFMGYQKSHLVIVINLLNREM